VTSPTTGMPPSANAAAAARAGPLSKPVVSRQVADARAAYIVGDMLSDNNARALTFGLASALALPFPAAVKTGTSKDMRDNWCIGWTSRYTVGVWVGNSSGQAMQQVSGVSGAAPIWRELMLALHAGSSPKPLAPPSGIVTREMQFEANGEPPRRELFVAGTEQSVIRLAATPVSIRNPAPGAIYALDPDIPPAAQRLRFAHEGHLDRQARAQWRLDGRVVGRGPSFDWMPMPGRHELALLDDRGRELQRVRFEVRGAGLRASGPPGAPPVGSATVASPGSGRPPVAPALIR
jgi:penicillin-binding protein 1C